MLSSREGELVLTCFEIHQIKSWSEKEQTSETKKSYLNKGTILT